MVADEKYFMSKDFRDKLKLFEEVKASGQPPLMFEAEDIIEIADYYNFRGDMARSRQMIDYSVKWFAHESSLPYICKASDLLTEGNIKEAERIADLVEDRDDPDFRYLEVSLLVAKGLLAEAEEYFEEYEKEIEDDEMDDFFLDAATIYNDYEYDKEAVYWLQRVEDKESADYREQYARLMFLKGNYILCAEIIETLVDEEPFTLFFWQVLATAYFYAGNNDEALRCSEYSLAIHPENDKGLYIKAKCLYSLGNYEEAAKFYVRYCKVSGEQP